MRRTFPLPRTRARQDGYALLLMVFLTTLLLISTMAVGLRVLTEGRRQKEAEMIWRGKQYTRAIKLYYRKFGRFPTSLDNLTQPQTGNVRFMRQAYTDPMNKQDGSWRLIYVGPAGQLLGSLKPQPSLFPSGPPGATPTPPGGLFSPGGSTGSGANPLSPTPGTFGSGFGAGTSGTSTAPGTGPGTASGTGSGTSGTGTDSTGTSTDTTGNTPTIVGGNIIGIGSKINQPSIMVYETATNYRLFEFVWNPSKEMGVISSQGPGIGTQPGTPGQTPTGPQPNPIGPQPAPQPPTNPNPQQQQ